MTITVIMDNGYHGEPTTIVFSGGEVHPNMSGLPELAVDGWIGGYAVKAVLKSSNDIMELMLVTDILKNKYHLATRRDLYMPYIPYARQDRPCAPGDAFGLSVFADMINSLNYTRVFVQDPHSDVAPALINNCVVETMAQCINNFERLVDYIDQDGVVLVSPDAGAVKKVQDVANHFNHANIIEAAKTRDCTTGKITGTTLTNCGGIPLGMKCLILDDICDGGRTFIELGMLLKSHGAEEVALYITHGMFSKGFEVFSGSIDKIFVGDSLRGNHYAIAKLREFLIVRGEE